VGESASEVIAYVDDDVVVEPTWARTIAAVMAANPDVAAVTGLVVPLELETEAQVLFERHGGFGRRFVRRWIRRPDGEHAARLFANTATFGTGANMAFRRNALLEIGLFDPALDAGTPSEAGGDLDVFFRVLAAGHTLVYEPAATVRHRHRRSMIEVESQMRGWPLGMLAYLARSEQAYPGDRAVFGTLANRLLFVHYPRRVAQSLFDASLRPSLTLAELRGAALGRRRFRVAREQATRLAAEFGYDLSGVVRDTAPIPPRRLAPVRGVRIDLSDPLPVVLPGSDDSDRVRVEVSRAGVGIGSVVLVTGGYSIGRERLADAIAAELGKRLLGPASVWRLALREAFSTA
jgi:hypothetical protein